MILTWLLKNWRLIGYAIVILVLIWAALVVRHWHEDSTVALPKAVAALKAEVACEPASECGKRVAAMQAAHKAIQDETARKYETRFAEIAARPVPREPVRLCRPANNRVRVPGAAPAVSTSEGTDVQVEVGRDIAVELYKLADDADREALKLELLYERDTALATPPK